MLPVLVRTALVLLITGATSAPTLGQAFVNWESPHVHPADLTPDGSRLLVVNTADGRLEVFDVTESGLFSAGSVPVGLDPVTVRARTDGEAWVANHVSDTVSVVDLDALSVRATIPTGDEPTDIVFAGSPERAFVSVSQLNQVKVYDPADLTVAPSVIEIEGEDPRALATDGTTVYLAIFESGNDTTIIGETVVTSGANPYTGIPNPPPNAGDGFDPPIADDLPTPPQSSLILRKDGVGAWRDSNDGDWSAAVTWDLHGHDLAAIDAETLTVTYASGLMNANMALGMAPDGSILVVGTEAINEVRFEPNLNGVFARVIGAKLDAGLGGGPTMADLNPHLDYTTSSVDQTTRDLSIGDPRGVAWSATGDRVFVTGMGSNNLGVFDASLGRVAHIEVGEGPTGVVADHAHGVLYVVNKFEGSVSTVGMASLAETSRLAFHDATPAEVIAGRPFLYDTHRTSGLGHLSCASCHIDGRMDQIAWDLGDPQGEMKEFNQVCDLGVGDACEDWHPMKGPMATQSLIGIIGTEPLHWRADREDLAAFNGAFEGLMGDDEQLATEEMDAFEAFVATLTYPPNPFRAFNGTLPSDLNGGNANSGNSLFQSGDLDGVNCVDCHAQPTGTNGQLTSAPLLGESQSFKIPQLRNLYEKTGFDETSMSNNRGFGYIHDGSVDDLLTFLEFEGFAFEAGAAGEQQRRDVAAFVFAFSTDTHPAVGIQATIGGDGLDQTVLRDQMSAIGNAGIVGLVVKGVVGGEQRGYYLLSGGVFQSDRAAETVTLVDLDAAAALAPITYTLVPAGSELRLGADRDTDGFLDRDELDACANPANPDSIPGRVDCPEDLAGGPKGGDGTIDVNDLLVVVGNWGQAGVAGDVDCSGTIDTDDLLAVIGAWGACP